jgi:alkanesulfonate monooxygenase SsuD/methylene tetrahydromethanopterin reductase-like flavin-dependent oxidoreductase (luciferase family)
MTALGVVFRPQLPPERLRDVAHAADDAGLEELWLWEDCFFESGIAAAAAALAWTQRLRVGVDLLPVPLRNGVAAGDGAPVVAGAIGPRSLRLAGEAADGSLLGGSISPDGVRRARRLIDEGRAVGGRTDHHEVIVYLPAATVPDGAVRLQAELEGWGDASTPELGVAGNAGVVAKAVQRLVDAGADTVVLQPTADEPDLEGFVRFVADEVRPLIP